MAAAEQFPPSRNKRVRRNDKDFADLGRFVRDDGLSSAINEHSFSQV
jgi:hypothetical protein